MDSFEGPHGGTERQLYELINGLDRKIFQPHLAVFRHTSFTEDKTVHFPCPITALNITKLAGLDTFLKLLKLSRHIRSEDFRLVHIFFNDAAMLTPLFCKMGGARIISSRRDMGFWYTTRNLLALKVSNLFVDRIVANSKAVKDNVNKKEGIPNEKINIIYNGCTEERFRLPLNTDLRKRFSIGENEHIIGMVANLRPIKRQIDLIRAFAIVRQKHSDTHLVFVGSAEIDAEFKILKKLVKTLHLESCVHFLGRVAEAVPVIKHFTVGVLCSESEGLSNSIIEYMGCGKPTICTNVGGNPELITDGYSGFLVDVGDINTLADRIVRILSSSSLASELGENALTSMKKIISMQKYISKHVELYEQLIHRETTCSNKICAWFNAF
jgi:glycosyltransferase involved in cell wall biosynthesis